MLQRLEEEGLLKDDKQPLFLPKRSIRLILTASFCGLAYYLYQENRLGEPESISLLGVVAAYVLGNLVRGIGCWFKGSDKNAKPSRLWQDGRAIVVLLAIVIAASAPLSNQPNMLPEQVHRIALGLVLFYFGSR